MLVQPVQFAGFYLYYLTKRISDNFPKQYQFFNQFHLNLSAKEKAFAEQRPKSNRDFSFFIFSKKAKQ